jgi:hypothetical protein
MTARGISMTVVAIALSIAGASASALPAQARNQPNKTGLPLYTHTIMGTQYDAAQDRGDKHWYTSYTAIVSSDSLEIVEAWYRHALPRATETAYVDGGRRGIEFTNGKDRVLVYKLGNNPGAVIELYKYARD